MTSLLRKAARMNLVAMDFVLQVTVVELVLGTLLDDGRTLSFELSRGTKSSGLPPKVVSTTRSEWEQTMQVVITLFLDKRSGRFQDKEYKLRLVQAEKGCTIIMAPALATFTLDASLYAHLGAGPSVDQPVDLYAPKLNGPGGFATVHLRVRCCETGRPSSQSFRSLSAPNVMRPSVSVRTPFPLRGPLDQSRPGLLVGSSFGFSMSGSESRYSAGSAGSSAFSTPILRRHRQSWSNEDIESAASMRSRSRMRRSMRAKLGSKSFNDLDDSVHLTSPGKRSTRFSSSEGTTYGHRTVRSSLSFGGLLGSMGGSSSVGGGQQSPRQQQQHRSALSGRRAVAVQTASA
ncbi:unnamed protein product, partial [Ectocarpus sp. 12 AP-2014]